MTDIDTLLKVAATYGEVCEVPESTVSKRALQDSSRLGELRAGGCDIGVKRLARVMQWFSDHWPTDAADRWPGDVARPPVSPIGVELEQAAS